MNPDFNQKTTNTLAKRAAFKCSNLDCRISTVGPNSDPEKSTVIGEAAHIYGARPGSKRFVLSMTDTARADITNGIWLCRNCHKLIDTDAAKYSSDILFIWREQHEEFVLSELGSAIDRIELEQQKIRLSLFENCPPIIRRIVIDKPDCWEWRLTSELMRHFNQPLFRKIEDLHCGLYVGTQEYISREETTNWIDKKISEASNLISPMVKLIDRLNKSWGPRGEVGSIDEIYHICSLIRDSIKQIVQFEESIYFANVPEECERLVDLLKNNMGIQAEKLAIIPDSLDESISIMGTNHGGTIDTPHVVEKEIVFEFPKGWDKKVNRELKRVHRRLSDDSEEKTADSWTTLLVVGFIIWLIFSIF